jgi:hypothetical protein
VRAVKSGSLVAVPLPNGSCSVLWILEAGIYEAKGYFQFLIMEGFPPVSSLRFKSGEPNVSGARS